MEYVGARLARVEPGFVEIHLPFRPELTQQHGVIHGGVVSMIVDSACGFAGLTLFPANTSILTVEYKINLLAPARGDALLARGWVARAGRTLTVCRGEAYAVTGGEEKLIATALETLIQLEGRPDIPSG
jgi:uncharacterized protein (TIGR00369 family)